MSSAHRHESAFGHDGAPGDMADPGHREETTPLSRSRPGDLLELVRRLEQRGRESSRPLRVHTFTAARIDGIAANPHLDPRPRSG